MIILNQDNSISSKLYVNFFSKIVRPPKLPSLLANSLRYLEGIIRLNLLLVKTTDAKVFESFLITKAEALKNATNSALHFLKLFMEDAGLISKSWWLTGSKQLLA